MVQALAPAPTRSHDSITIAAGMVTIPLSVMTGTEATRVNRKEFFQGDPNISIGRTVIRKDTGEVVEKDDVVRMALADNGNWVTLTDDEIAASTTPRGMAEVLCFVPVKDFGQYLTENMAQVRVKKDSRKPNLAAEKAFAMLLAGMRARKVGALIKVAMRGPARYAIVTPDADLLYIYPADGVRQPAVLPDTSVSKAEVAMATALIDTFGVDTPVLTDDTAVAVQAFVNAKAAGMPTVEHVEMAPVTDLMAAFQASIDAATAAKSKKAS